MIRQQQSRLPVLMARNVDHLDFYSSDGSRTPCDRLLLEELATVPEFRPFGMTSLMHFLLGGDEVIQYPLAVFLDQRDSLGGRIPGNIFAEGLMPKHVIPMRVRAEPSGDRCSRFCNRFELRIENAGIDENCTFGSLNDAGIRLPEL